MDPSLAGAYEALGYCQFQLRDFDAAQAAYRKAVELDPRMASAYAGLGSIEMLKHLQHEAGARPELAMEYWHRSLELDADQPKVRRLIEKYRRPMRDPDSVLLDSREGR
jgi:Tfp pilus assembly protein PilF